MGVGALFDNALLTELPESGEVRDFKRVREESEKSRIFIKIHISQGVLFEN